MATVADGAAATRKKRPLKGNPRDDCSFISRYVLIQCWLSLCQQSAQHWMPKFSSCVACTTTLLPRRWTYAFVNPLLDIGQQRPLQEEDLYELAEHDKVLQY
jgi:hypothetical protein